AIEPRAVGRRVRTVAKRPHFDEEAGLWPVPLPTIDPLVVKRSAVALDRYGPDFSYAHYVGVKRRRTLVAGIAVVGATTVTAQAMGPNLLDRLVRAGLSFEVLERR